MNYVKSILDYNCVSMKMFCDRITGQDYAHFRNLLKGKHTPRHDTIKMMAKGLERLDGTKWQEHAKNIFDEIRGGE